VKRHVVLAIVPASLLLSAIASPAAALPPEQETEHVVQDGETLNGIANRAKVRRDAIAEANGLEPPYVVKTGQKLVIPRGQAKPARGNSYVVKEGDTLGGIANRAKVTRDALAAANGIEAPYIVKIGQKLVIPRGEDKSEAPTPAKREEAPSEPGQKVAAAAPAATPAPPPAAAAPKPVPPPPAAAAPKPDAAPDSAQPETYLVQEGETLGGIANRTQVPRVLIAEANGLEPPYIVKTGQKLLIPRTRHHVVSEGETGFAISYRYAVPWENIALANGIEPDAPIKTGQKLLIPTILDRPATKPEPPKAPAAAAPVAKPAPAKTPSPTKTPAPAATPATQTARSMFVWPAEGDIRRGYRARGEVGYHDGIDIAAPQGATVKAAAAGKVIFAANEPKQFGNLVIIDHGNGWHSAYASLDRMTVKPGYQIAQGERLGTVGDTSITRKVELHFELRQGGNIIDPLTQLPETP